MRRILWTLALVASLLSAGLPLAQSGFPGSGQVYPPGASAGTNIFTCKGAASPFADCGYSVVAFSASAWTVVTKFQPAALSLGAPASAINLTVQAPSSGTLTTTLVTICPSAISGTTQLWSCAAAPTEIKFNGASGFVAPTCGTQCTSDRTVFTMVGSNAYSIAFNVSASSSGAIISPGPTTSTPSSATTSFVAYSKTGSEANTQTRASGYATNIGGTARTLAFVYRIGNVQ